MPQTATVLRRGRNVLRGLAGNGQAFPLPIPGRPKRPTEGLLGSEKRNESFPRYILGRSDFFYRVIAPFLIGRVQKKREL